MASIPQGAGPAPRVSVLLPSYNHARFVLGAVQSALDQTETAIEVIVIDDGSTDDSLARLATVDDPRVEVLSQPNQGLSQTLNRALERARGKWVKFLPSDDMLAPACLERQLRIADELGGGVVFCLPEVVDAEGRPLADPAPQAWFDTAARDGAEILLGLIERNFLSAPGALFERELARRLGGFDPGMRVAQDYDLWLKMLPRCAARLEPERLVRVRWHGANQSAIATPETEAERSRALLRAIADVGIDGWLARFAGAATGRRRAVQGRRALAGALVRSGLPEARELADRLDVEASRLERGGVWGVARRALPRALDGVLQAARRILRPRWRAALEARSTAPSRAPAIAAGPCVEHWLVLDPEPASTSGDARGRALADALARRGVRVTYAAPLRPGSSPLAAESAPALVDWRRESLRPLLDGGDDALRLLVESPHPEAVALAREAAAAGARVVFDRGGLGEARPPWYDAESEKRIADDADDLVVAGVSARARTGSAKRLVHVLPSPEGLAPVESRKAWDAHAASLVQIASRPIATAILVARGDDPDLGGALSAVFRSRRAHAFRTALVLLEPAVLPEALEGRLAAESMPLLRSARADAAAARELGLRATRGEIVAWLSPSAAPFLEDGWLDRAVAVLVAHREVGVVAIGASAAPGERARPVGAAAGEALARASAGPGAAPPSSWVEVAELAGPIVVARRAVLARLPAAAGVRGPGGSSLVEADDDLARRLRAAGYRLAILV